MKKKLSKENIELGLDVASNICTLIHVPIMLRRIYKRGAATPAEALFLALDGIAIGSSMNRFSNYLNKKLEENIEIEE